MFNSHSCSLVQNWQVCHWRPLEVLCRVYPHNKTEKWDPPTPYCQWILITEVNDFLIVTLLQIKIEKNKNTLDLEKLVVAGWLHLIFKKKCNGLQVDEYPKSSATGGPLKIARWLHRSPDGRQPVSKHLSSDSLSEKSAKICKNVFKIYTSREIINTSGSIWVSLC